MTGAHGIFKICVVVGFVFEHAYSALREERVAALEVGFCDNRYLHFARKPERAVETAYAASDDQNIGFHG